MVDPLTARGGDWVVSTFFPLHTGEAFGALGRILISVVGVTPLAFFITGIVVWLRFRRKPAKPARPTAPAVARPAPVRVTASVD